MGRPAPPVSDPGGSALGWRALGVFALSRLLTAVAIALVATQQVPIGGMGDTVDYWDMAGLWDARWYEAIALDGYPDTIEVDAAGIVERPVYAFSPLFPVLARGGMALTGASFAVVGSTIALLAGAAAAVVVAHLLRPRVGDRAALWSVAVLAAFPTAPVLQIAYADSLGLLLVAAFLLAVDRRRWYLAAGLAVAVGFTRPLAPALLAVVAAVAWELWRRREDEPVGRRQAVAVATCALAVLAGNVAWAAYAWARTGEPSAYTDSQAAWWHGPHLRPFELFRAPAFDVLVVVLILAGVALGCAARRSERLGLPMRAWCVGYAAQLAVVGGNLTPTLRHLLLLFPLAPVALGAAGPDGAPPNLSRRGALLVGLGAVGAAAWVAVLLRYTPPSDLPP